MTKVRPTASAQSYTIVLDEAGIVDTFEFQFVEITDDGSFEPVETPREEAIRGAALDELTPGEQGQVNAVIVILRNLRDSKFAIT